MPTSIFKKIIDKKIEAFIIDEDDHNLAFLDINPVQIGHTLVIPKKEVDNIYELNDIDYISLFSFSKIIAKSIKKTFQCEKVGTAIIGLEVPHAHIHLLPINSLSDFDFQKSKIRLNKEQLYDIANKIKRNILKNQ